MGDFLPGSSPTSYVNLSSCLVKPNWWGPEAGHDQLLRRKVRDHVTPQCAGMRTNVTQPLKGSSVGACLVPLPALQFRGSEEKRPLCTESLFLPWQPFQIHMGSAHGEVMGLAELMNYRITQNLPPCSSLTWGTGSSSAKQESVLTPNPETHTLTLRWREGLLGSSPCWHKLKSENGPAILLGLKSSCL